MNRAFDPAAPGCFRRCLTVSPVPSKTCPYNCIYCQSGRTTHKTLLRREWIPLEQVVENARKGLSSRPSCILLSGAGEPTLYSRLGDLIERLRSLSDLPVAVLSGGGMLWNREVRYQLRSADLVIPSLDAGDAELFDAVNRPHPAICFEQVLDGLLEFRQEFRGQYWLEVLLVAGFTTVRKDLLRLASVARRINADFVQISTILRPPAEDFAFPVRMDRLQQAVRYFGPRTGIFALPQCRASAKPRPAFAGMSEGRRPARAPGVSGSL